MYLTASSGREALGEERERERDRKRKTLGIRVQGVWVRVQGWTLYLTARARPCT